MNNKIIFVFITLILSSQFLLAEEITLYNPQGIPIAYIDTDDEDIAIYMWDGNAVAYLHPDDMYDYHHIYGYNGKHLGWYEEGMVLDHNGYIVGFVEGVMNIYLQFEPFKLYKKIKPFKTFREFIPYKPVPQIYYSDEKLTDFLMKGTNK